MIEKKSLKSIILQVILIAVVAFILWNVVFILDYLFSLTILDLVKLLTGGSEQDFDFLMPLIQVAYASLFGRAAWLVWKSRVKIIYKAIFLTIPMAIVLVLAGIFFYRWPAAAFGVGTLATLGVLFQFQRTKQPWQYWWSVIFTSVALAIFFLSGGEI